MLEAISWLTNLGKILYPQTMKTVWVIEGKGWNVLNLSKLKGHNSRELHGICLVIELGQRIKPTNIAAKFYDDPMKNIF